MSSKAAASECNWTFSGVSIVFVFWVRIFWAWRTSCGLIVLGVICCKSILNEGFPTISLAVFQFTFLKPLRATTIYNVFSTKGWGFAIVLSSRIAALVKQLRLSFISDWASSLSSYFNYLLKSDRIYSSILSIDWGAAPWIFYALPGPPSNLLTFNIS